MVERRKKESSPPRCRLPFAIWHVTDSLARRDGATEARNRRPQTASCLVQDIDYRSRIVSIGSAKFTRWICAPHRGRRAGVFHQMPAIRDLNRLRERFLSRQRVTAAPIARDDGDLWLAGEQACAVECRWGKNSPPVDRPRRVRDARYGRASRFAAPMAPIRLRRTARSGNPSPAEDRTDGRDLLAAAGGASRFKNCAVLCVTKFHAAVAAGSPTGFWRMSRQPGGSTSTAQLLLRLAAQITQSNRRDR